MDPNAHQDSSSTGILGGETANSVPVELTRVIIQISGFSVDPRQMTTLSTEYRRMVLMMGNEAGPIAPLGRVSRILRLERFGVAATFT